MNQEQFVLAYHWYFDGQIPQGRIKGGFPGIRVIERRVYDAITDEVRRAVEKRLPHPVLGHEGHADYARSALQRLLETEYYAQLERKIVMILAEEWITAGESFVYESKGVGSWVFE